MPSNTRKPQPNLSKPSEGGSFGAGSKPTESTNPLGGLNITAQRELGTVNGIKVTGKLNVGVDNLLGQQGINIEIDATNRTAGFGAGLGSTKGKLGVNIGAKVGYDEEGNVSIKSAEGGVNIAGFGVGASIDEDEGIKGSISAAGATVEIGVAPDGKKIVSLCYGVPGGEVCVTFEPDDDTKSPTTSPSPSPSPGTTLRTNWTRPSLPTGDLNKTCTLVLAFDERFMGWDVNGSLSYHIEYHGNGNVDSETWSAHAEVNMITNYPDPIRLPNPKVYTGGILVNRVLENREFPGVYEIALTTEGRQLDVLWYIRGREDKLYNFLNNSIYVNREIIGTRSTYNKTYKIVYSNCSIPDNNAPPSPSPSPSPSLLDKIRLPNYPQHFRRMDCCDQVKEIYRYLGIAKLKRNKFPVSNAFLVPGGKGNDNCLDYYSIMQALFRMLANGLIINPKSKPLGSEWQNVNATAWASAMYEMLAESMSDGNTTQRFEVATIMQLTQMMATLAENGRKIEFVADAIGIEPVPTSEDVPVCFTIYEGHKGFGKKEPKKINVSGLKTDDDVEKVLGKMLNPSLIPITAWKFKPGQISINETLKNG
jgi:hypothetical protein